MQMPRFAHFSVPVLALLAACERPTAIARVNAAPPVESIDHVPVADFLPTGRWHWDGPSECDPDDRLDVYPHYRFDLRASHVVRLVAPSRSVPRSQLWLEYDAKRRLLTFVERRDVTRPDGEPFRGATVVIFGHSRYDRIISRVANVSAPGNYFPETKAIGRTRELWDHPLLGASGKLVALALERCGLTGFATTFDEFLPKQ